MLAVPFRNAVPPLRVFALAAVVLAMGPPSSIDPIPTPIATQIPTTTLTPGESVRVTSIAALLTALDDNTMTDIVVADGTYRVSAAASQKADSLWIGARFADRTKAVTVRAETRGGVTFDGGGATWFGGLSFEEGAHDQTWDGFTFANGKPTETGVITFGGYAGKAAPHHITLRNITITRSITSSYAGSQDHAMYFSQAVGGPHDILVDGYAVDGAGGVNTAVVFYHSSSGNQNAWNVTIRNMTVTGTYEPVELWDSTLHDVLIEDATITNARLNAVRYEQGNSNSDIVLSRVTTTGSGQMGFYSSMGSKPPGVTFTGNSFD